MTSKELIRNTLARKKTDRIPILDLAYWPETIDRWIGEGLPADADVEAYFGLDRLHIHIPDDSPRLARAAVEEDSETLVFTNNFGCTIRKWKDERAPQVNLRFAVEDLAEAEVYMDQYDTIRNDDMDDAWIAPYELSMKRGDFMTIAPLEPAWFVIEFLLGFEKGLIAFAEEPERVYGIMKRLMDHSLAHIKWLIEDKGFKFDALWFFADLCYKNGMLLSPRIYRDVVQPIHQEYKRFCDEHDMFLILHCDGDVREFIPLVIESGFNAIQPLEARAGNDVRELKDLYGDKITLFGNINADVIAGGSRGDIEEEVTSKVNAAKAGGGYIYHIDHSVPPTISLENYRIMIELIKRNMYI